MLVISAASSVGLYVLCFRDYAFGKDSEAFGTFGSYFGGVAGCVCSFIGIIFLYRTYRIQLDITHYQEQFQTISKFEDDFFELLSQQRDICKSISNKYTTSKGKRANIDNNEFFNKLSDDFRERLQNNMGYEDLDAPKNIQKVRFNNVYQEFYEGYCQQLGHYFRHLYHILKYIDDADFINEKKKREYSDLLQAQMSNDELYLTAMNGISNYGRHRLLPLLDKYSFLENLHVKDEISDMLIRVFYTNTKRKDMKNEIKNILFIGGIHCSGKGVLSEKICKKYKSLTPLTASKVLGWNGNDKVVSDVDKTQMRFEENLQSMTDMDTPYLLDGHFCLWTKDYSIEKIPMRTFKAINPYAIVLVESDANTVLDRLKRRDGKEYKLVNITELQTQERLYAESVAKELNVEFVTYNNEDEEPRLNSLVESFISQFD
jgi:adenylate kinase